MWAGCNISREIYILLLGVVITGLSGCGVLQSKLYSGYSSKTLANKDVTAVSKIKNQLMKGPSEEDVAVSEQVQACYYDGVNTPQCKTLRNQAVVGLITVADELCLEHFRSIYGNEAAYNLLFGSLTNLFAGAATVASGEATKTLLAGLAAFSSAERSLINETVYKTMVAQAVTKKIRDAKTEQRKAILKKITNDIDHYSMDESLLDVIEYHQTCSFMFGLEKALEEGTQNNSDSKRARTRNDLEQKLKLALIELDDRKRLKAADAETDPQVIKLTDRINTLNDQIKTLDAEP